MSNINNEPSLLKITTGNEIGRKGVFLGGVLIFIFTLLPIILIMAIWPDRLPKVGVENLMLYNMEAFNVQYAGESPKPKNIQRIHLNTILFLLVILSGFLGSMVHLATSFTNYIGSEKFKRTWTLWYIVKPFTAAGIALILYFILRAGLLNYGDSNNINLYGIVTLAAFTGLFTDKATLKLEEIFTVIFKPKDERPDKIESNATNLKITGIKPEELLVDEENNLTITGDGLEGKKVIIKLNNIEVANPMIKSDSISFSYKIPENLKEADIVLLQVYDENGNELYKKDLLLKTTILNEEIEEDEEILESEYIKG